MMSAIQTTSAALYFDRTERASIPLLWFERARDVFTDFDLSPILFTANDNEDFLLDDCYLLASKGHDIVLWNETIPGRNDDLIAALGDGKIDDLCLDVPRNDARTRSAWHANVSISLVTGICHIGLDIRLISDVTELIRRAVELVCDLFAIRYGIAYQMPLAQYPDCYASGSSGGSSLSEALWMIQHRDEWERRTKTPDELWSEELMGERRHLTGLFRGAYPANILSEAHVRSAALLSRGIGKLTELENSLWLWELTDSEIPEAQRMLESRGVLVIQAASK
jgi:hypothetical protein